MAESFRTNLFNVSRAYVQLLCVKVTDTSLKERLTENPFYPSLYSLSNVFDRYHINHAAFRVDKDNIADIQTPFIAYLSNQPTGTDFVTVLSMSGGEVSYVSDKKKEKTVSKEKFLEDFQGVVLKAEAGEHSGESNFEQKKHAEIKHRYTNWLLIASSLFVFLVATWSFLNGIQSGFVGNAAALLLIKIIGLAATVLLLIYEIDKSNSFVKNICTAGSHTNCDAVLHSNAAKVLGMSWSEAGFFYFTSSLLFLMLPGVDISGKITVLATASLMASPYILFSVYYQWRVVKQWCPLCLTVQAVLAAELVWCVYNVWMGQWMAPPVGILFPIAGCILLPMTLWFVLKPILKNNKEMPLYKAAYKRLLYNPETFYNLLQQQKEAPDGYQDIGITMGNPEAQNTIIKVCNPYCGPCARAHPVLHDIVKNNSDIKLKLIFTATNDNEDKRGEPARHMLAISKVHPEQTGQALDDWYLTEKKDYGVFAAKYLMNGELKEQEPEIEKMKAWCDKAEITFTPTIYINGHRLPEKYSVNELKYVL